MESYKHFPHSIVVYNLTHRFSFALPIIYYKQAVPKYNLTLGRSFGYQVVSYSPIVLYDLPARIIPLSRKDPTTNSRAFNFLFNPMLNMPECSSVYLSN